MAKDRITNAVNLPSTAVQSEPPDKKGRKPMSPEEKAARIAALKNEPKDQKFRRLAMHRMPRALKTIKQLANLANRSQYEWTQEQCNKIIDTLAKSVKTVADKFAGNKDNGETFSL